MAGNTKIIVNTIGLGIPWSLNETYRIAMDQGFVEQAEGLKLPLKGNSNILSFSTPANPPQISTTIPTHTTRATAGFGNISFTIDRKQISILSGNVYLNKQGNTNVIVRTYSISNASVSGNVVTLPIIGNIEANLTYFVTSDANIFLDNDGFKNSTITNSNTFRFISPLQPQIISLKPNNTGFCSPNIGNIRVTFDRSITNTNSGNIYLYNTSNVLIKTYPLVSNVTVGNANIILNVSGLLANSVSYYVTSDANIIQDNTQIKYNGISNSSVWTFNASDKIASPPTNIIAYPISDTTANVSYTAPLNNNGITKYTAVSVPGNISANILTANSGNITITGLTTNTEYLFYVYGTNVDGAGDFSVDSNLIKTKGIPDAPTITSVQISHFTSISANVSYTVPAYDGGSPITSLTLMANIGNLSTTTFTSNSGNITLSGLDGNKTYNFTMYATNSYGNSINSLPFTVFVPSSSINTQILLHFEGANGSQTYTDSSLNSLEFTTLSNYSYISTNDKYFGNSSFRHSRAEVMPGTPAGPNGTGLYILGSRPPQIQCQGDFTIEFFANLNSAGSVQCPFGLGQALFNMVFVWNGGNPYLAVEKSTSGTYASGFKQLNYSFSSSNYGVWKHYALVRSGNTLTFYVNGTEYKPSGWDTFFSDGNPSTGADNQGNIVVAVADMYYNADYGMRGSYMDEFRFSNIALYTSSFTPPSSAFIG